MGKVTQGQLVSVHYVGKFDDGTVFDSSRERGVPLEFLAGAGQMIPGFDSEILTMSTGELRTFRLVPAGAYGQHRDELVQKINTALFPKDFEFVEGATVRGDSPNGQPLLAKIVSHLPSENAVVLDFNHPMAGKSLNFEVEVLSAEDVDTTT